MTELRALWRRVDDAGVDWISVWDHFYETPPAGGTIDQFEAVATLGALAADTSNARLGCLVFCVPYRNPGLLAKAATTIDHISGGRFELGLGAGWHQWEADAYGYDFPAVGTRLDMLEEAVPLIRSLLTEARTTRQGRHFTAVDASCLPHPVQPRLPIWVGGAGERRTLRIAAREADGWNAPYSSVAEFARLNGVLDEWCDKEGRDPATLARTVNLFFAASSTGADADTVLTSQGFGAALTTARAGAVSGSPAEAAEHALRYVEAGAHGVNVALRRPWDDRALDEYLALLPELRRLSEPNPTTKEQ